MEILEINISNIEDLLDKYDKKTASQDLINHLIESTLTINLKKEIKIIINNNINTEQSCIPFIIAGLKKEYNKNVLKYNYDGKIQFIYFVLGVIILFISTLIKSIVLKEVILISGWVLIWSMLEIEIFTDMKIRKKRKIIKKLIESEMEEIKIIGSEKK